VSPVSPDASPRRGRACASPEPGAFASEAPTDGNTPSLIASIEAHVFAIFRPAVRGTFLHRNLSDPSHETYGSISPSVHEQSRFVRQGG
jgi:hypothetical protein